MTTNFLTDKETLEALNKENKRLIKKNNSHPEKSYVSQPNSSSGSDTNNKILQENKVFIERAGKLDKERIRAVCGTDEEFSKYVDKITNKIPQEREIYPNEFIQDYSEKDEETKENNSQDEKANLDALKLMSNKRSGSPDIYNKITREIKENVLKENKHHLFSYNEVAVRLREIYGEPTNDIEYNTLNKEVMRVWKGLPKYKINIIKHNNLHKVDRMTGNKLREEYRRIKTYVEELESKLKKKEQAISLAFEEGKSSILEQKDKWKEEWGREYKNIGIKIGQKQKVDDVLDEFIKELKIEIKENLNVPPMCQDRILSKIDKLAGVQNGKED